MRGITVENKVSEENKVSGKNRISETVLLDCLLIVVLAILSYYLDTVVLKYIIRAPCLCLTLLTIIGVARAFCDVDEIPRMMI